MPRRACDKGKMRSGPGARFGCRKTGSFLLSCQISPLCLRKSPVAREGSTVARQDEQKQLFPSSRPYFGLRIPRRMLRGYCPIINVHLTAAECNCPLVLPAEVLTDTMVHKTGARLFLTNIGRFGRGLKLFAKRSSGVFHTEFTEGEPQRTQRRSCFFRPFSDPVSAPSGVHATRVARVALAAVGASASYIKTPS
jgi:hypothetical protein